MSTKNQIRLLDGIVVTFVTAALALLAYGFKTDVLPVLFGGAQ